SRLRLHLVARDACERALDHAVVVARPAGHRTVAECLGSVAVVAGERRVADLVGDLVAEPGDDAVSALELVELLERDLRPLPVGDVPERLPETGEVLTASGRTPPVGAEARTRDRSAARAGRLRHVGRDGPHRGSRELAAEARHPVSPAPYLAEHRGLVRPQLVEIGPNLPVRARGAERVAVRAAG